MFGLTPFNRHAVQKTNNEFVDFYNMIDDFFNDSFLPGRSLRSDTFKLDVKENEQEFLIEAEMPGIKKEEINLDYNDGRLTILVQRNEEVNEEKQNYIHRERRAASMQRGLYLKNIKADSIDAKLENGILKIIAPKLELEANKQRIEIK
ncbi:Hsp20/alpha crystallin family protein [Cellulosilyticum sp. I15G10I2]|uniref:Hsp20/alpha crystallin family protein n=1 Tax=Cellulosilyticum sp. I15G10I2 TaxID=1892843 RepID=UPI00085BECC5|nr:Hsp20/alpha crystallin family protein [Cellulosilyticum sp. I15G10I2]